MTTTKKNNSHSHSPNHDSSQITDKNHPFDYVKFIISPPFFCVHRPFSHGTVIHRGGVERRGMWCVAVNIWIAWVALLSWDPMKWWSAQWPLDDEVGTWIPWEGWVQGGVGNKGWNVGIRISTTTGWYTKFPRKKMFVKIVKWKPNKFEPFFLMFFFFPRDWQDSGPLCVTHVDRWNHAAPDLSWDGKTL